VVGAGGDWGHPTLARRPAPRQPLRPERPQRPQRPGAPAGPPPPRHARRPGRRRGHLLGLQQGAAALAEQAGLQVGSRHADRRSSVAGARPPRSAPAVGGPVSRVWAGDSLSWWPRRPSRRAHTAGRCWSRRPGPRSAWCHAGRAARRRSSCAAMRDRPRPDRWPTMVCGSARLLFGRRRWWVLDAAWSEQQATQAIEPVAPGTGGTWRLG
jgi:hypothetical protein